MLLQRLPLFRVYFTAFWPLKLQEIPLTLEPPPLPVSFLAKFRPPFFSFFAVPYAKSTTLSSSSSSLSTSPFLVFHGVTLHMFFPTPFLQFIIGRPFRFLPMDVAIPPFFFPPFLFLLNDSLYFRIGDHQPRPN